MKQKARSGEYFINITVLFVSNVHPGSSKRDQSFEHEPCFGKERALRKNENFSFPPFFSTEKPGDNTRVSFFLRSERRRLGPRVAIAIPPGRPQQQRQQQQRQGV